MDNLRLILILAGAAVLALIWLTYRPEGSERRAGAKRKPARREPSLGKPATDDARDSTATAEPDESVPAAGEPEQAIIPELGEKPDPSRAPARIDPVLEAGSSSDLTAHDSHPEGAASPKVVTVYLRARGNRKISGLSLLDAATKAGLRFGEMKIFHRRHRGADKPVFSMADITRPGTFDPTNWNLFETPGVTLFMTLPGPVSGLDALDAMLATGRRLSELLDADLLDNERQVLTRERLGRLREQVREFDREHGLPE